MLGCARHEPAPPRLGHRAIVAGGSLAGMLGTRAVAAHFDEVVVIERMLPGFRAAIEASGSAKINVGLDFVSAPIWGWPPASTRS